MACDCRGVMHVCPESWEFLRKEHGMTVAEMDAMLAPARRHQAVLKLVLGPRHQSAPTSDDG